MFVLTRFTAYLPVVGSAASWKPLRTYTQWLPGGCIDAPNSHYRRHPNKDRAVIDLYDTVGRRTQRLLPGSFGSSESTAAYHELLGKLQVHDGKLPLQSPHRLLDDITLNHVVLRFLTEKVAVDYVDEDGQPTTEQGSYRQALKPLARLYGWSTAREFDAASLEKVRDSMVSGSWMNDDERSRLTRERKPTNWSRGNISKSISRIRSMFRWAGLKTISPSSVVHDVECLPPLKTGRGGVRESVSVLAVSPEVVEATFTYLPPVTGDLVRIVVFTGARIGEICKMRSGDLDRSGPVWIYRPRSHKNKHRGHLREICCGPQAQIILRRYLKVDPDSVVFSPREQAELIRQMKRGIARLLFNHRRSTAPSRACPP